MHEALQHPVVQASMRAITEQRDAALAAAAEQRANYILLHAEYTKLKEEHSKCPPPEDESAPEPGEPANEC